MIKSYEQYIKEHFGAITIEYPPEDMFTRNPSVPTPLALNTHVGGSTRLPMHWNNSPFLSGGFGGSGYGRFGSDPDGEDIDVKYNRYHEMDSHISNLLYNTQIELEVHNKTTGYEKILDEIKENIANGKLILDEDYLELDAGTINEEMMDSDIVFEIEMIQPPTSGDSGDYFNPPDPGESGYYETTVDYSTINGSTIKPNGGNTSPIDEIVDRFTKNRKVIQSSMYRAGLSEVYDYMASTISEIADWISNKCEDLDTEYIEDGTSSKEENAGEIVENMGILYYIFRIDLVEIDTEENYTAIRKLNRRISRPPKDQYMLADQCNQLMSTILTIPTDD